MWPALPTAAAGAAVRPFAAMLATGLLAPWLGTAATTPPDGPHCAGGDETTQLRCMLDAVIDESSAVIDQKNALIDEKNAIIEALQAALRAQEATDFVRSGALQDAAAHLAAPRRTAGRDAQGSTAQHEEDAAAHLAALPRPKEARRHARDSRRSRAQPAEDERNLARARRPPDPREPWEDEARWLAEKDRPGWRKLRRPPTAPGRETTEARRLPEAAQAGQLCTDYPVGWVDWNGYDCHVYVQAAYCTPTGGYGAWWWMGGTFDDYAANGATAPMACCGCGGGEPCMDTAGWTDKNGNTCAAYTSKGYCDGDGGTGAGWPPAWGTFANQTVAGKATAATACCACRPRARDASGRGCDYYALHPAQCGCCDDEDFQAQLTCSSACSTTSAEQDLTLRLAGWTNDTRMIIFPGNGMTGTIPTDWSTRFPGLHTVELSINDLTGTLPPELGMLLELRDLGLGVNALSGSIPAQLSLLKNLQYLYIHNNQLRGTVAPELGQLASLQLLYLSDNQLTGTIPPELGNLRNLMDLSFVNNMMDGPIPAELGQLSNLRYLFLHGNGFTGTVAPELGQLANLQILFLSKNQLTGTIPRELGNLHRLTDLFLSNNRVDGPIPAELGQMSNLRNLYLSDNGLTGTLAAELGQLASLESLYLFNNHLTGSIPRELGNLDKLTDLALSNNMMDGPIPAELGQLSNLQSLLLRDNGFTGTVSPELGQLATLDALFLNNNQLTGTIPPELGNLRNLRDLALQNNHLEGTLPGTLGNLVQLNTLNIGGNRFHGSLPAEIGALVMLSVLQIDQNEFSGTLPGEVMGNWRWMRQLWVSYNLFDGPVPSELGLLQNVTNLALGGNRFTSLPAEIGKMQALQDLGLEDNPMTGAFPDTSGCPKLRLIEASRCNFTTAGAVGAAVEILHFSGNNFSSLPDSWVNLPAVTDLDLSSNNISTWRPFGVLREGIFRPDNSFLCGYHPMVPRLNWPQMEKVDLSGNPFGDDITVRDFIWSLAYLRRLTDLRARHCGLGGDVPNEGPNLAWDMPNTGDGDCSDLVLRPRAGYSALFTLDLADNFITSIKARPSPRLSKVTLSNNMLTGVALDPSWYTIEGSLEVWDNPLLRASVAPPGRCSSVGADGLQADGAGFGLKADTSGDTYECTALCKSLTTRYVHDSWLNVSNLCRCKAGQQGTAMNCSGCPPNTFSEEEDQWGMVRTCRACPALSTTDAGVENATSVDQCRCPPGWYMGMVPVESNITSTGDASNQTSNRTSNQTGNQTTATTQACVQCKQRQFQTTARGANKETECVCNSDYEGLRAFRGACGCVDGYYMDHVAKICRLCAASVEKCNWGKDVELSLFPPVVKQGFWAEPLADDAAGNFSKNGIWRCVSKETCKEGSVCAEGRQGRGCSLCSAGMYGGPDGPCRRCPRSPEQSRQVLLLVLLIGPAATLAAHLLLQGSESPRQLILSLQSVRTSVKQLLKYLQMVGVLSVFSVRWPSAARSFFTNITNLIVTLPEVAGVACLTGQQTATLEMGFRWSLPVAGLASACLTALLLLPTRCLCRKRSWYVYVKMDRWDVLRVSLWGLVLFQSTVLQFGTQVLTCAPSPNGVATVLSFPHLQCRRGEEEWEHLAGISFAFLAAFVLAVIAAVYSAWRHTVYALVESSFTSRGWWGFLFSDFRSGSTQWVMLVMAKDIGLVVIATAGVGNGPSQLLATAVGATLYSYIVLRDQPFRDPSNNFLEAWTAMSLASLSVFSAGMGYQATPGQDDGEELYPGGVDDGLYKSRARAMVTLQWLTLVGPAGTILYQIVSLSERVKRRLPLFLRPMIDEERKAWNDKFLASLGIHTEAAEFNRVVENFDDIDGSQLCFLMGTSTATLGLVPTYSTGIQAAGRRRMEDVARRCGSLPRRVAAPIAPDAEEEDGGDPGAAAHSGSVGEAGPLADDESADEADLHTPEPEPGVLAASPITEDGVEVSSAIVLL